MVQTSLLELTLQILEASVFTFARIWVIMLISVGLSLIVGTLAARIASARVIIIPLVDVLEAVPVVAFFPVVLVFFVSDIGGSIGSEFAVDFLILTATVWNMILSAFEGVRSIPEEYIYVQKVYGFSFLSRIGRLYFPAGYSKVLSNISPSFSSALFYVTLSEVIQIGSSSFSVFGIGTLATEYSASGNLPGLELLIGVLVAIITLNYLFIIGPWTRSSSSYAFDAEGAEKTRKTGRITTTLMRSVRETTNIFVSSGEKITKVITRAHAERKSQYLRKRILSELQLNLLVGGMLALALAIAVYGVLASGFYEAIITYLFTPSFLLDSSVGLGYDLMRIAIVYSFTLITMVPLAIYLGRRSTQRLLPSALQVVYSLPAPIFLPILLISLLPWATSLFGFGIAFNGIVLLIAYLSAAQYVFFNVYGAIQTIPAEMEMVSFSYNIRGFRKFRNFTLPAIFPSLVTGSVASIGSYWGGLLISEYVSFHGRSYFVTHGLMASLDRYMFAGGRGLLVADAIDVFLVLFILAFTFIITMRLYSVAKKRFSLNA
jgi:NitT/TauT family transport system permease protein